MELVQSRIVTDDVEGLAAFYARLTGTPVALNEYYVEVPAGAVSVGFSKCRFTECGAWVMLPTIQPWGNRSMIFRDPEGNLVSVFARSKGVPG